MSSPCRQRRRIWRRLLERSDSGSGLRQRPRSDLLRPPRHQTGRPAEGAGVLHSVFQPLLEESAAHLQPAETGERRDPENHRIWAQQETFTDMIINSFKL